MDDMDTLLKKLGGQLERFEAHFGQHVSTGKALDIPSFTKRLVDLESKLNQAHGHLKKSDVDDAQYQSLKSINSALNRRAALQRIEKGFETTPMARTDGFAWAANVKP